MSKNKIGFSKPPEPKFIREMKAKLGYRDPSNMEDKLIGDAGDFDDREGDDGRDNFEIDLNVAL